MTTANGPTGTGARPLGDAEERSSAGSDVTTRHSGVEAGRSQTDETKHATKSSEFWTWALLAISLIIASAVASGFGPDRFWRYLTILTVAYLVSRGLAKALRGRGGGNETKPSFKTTELWIFLAALLALFITGAATGEERPGEPDALDASGVWLYAAILAAGYLVSRGLAKSGAGAQASSADHGSGGAPLGDRVKAAAQALSGSDGSAHGGRSGRQ